QWFGKQDSPWQQELGLRYERLHGHLWDQPERLQPMLDAYRKWLGQRQEGDGTGASRLHGLRFELALMLRRLPAFGGLPEDLRQQIDADVAVARLRGPMLESMQ